MNENRTNNGTDVPEALEALEIKYQNGDSSRYTTFSVWKPGHVLTIFNDLRKEHDPNLSYETVCTIVNMVAHESTPTAPFVKMLLCTEIPVWKTVYAKVYKNLHAVHYSRRPAVADDACAIAFTLQAINASLETRGCVNCGDGVSFPVDKYKVPKILAAAILPGHVRLFDNMNATELRSPLHCHGLTPLEFDEALSRIASACGRDLELGEATSVEAEVKAIHILGDKDKSFVSGQSFHGANDLTVFDTPIRVNDAISAVHHSRIDMRDFIDHLKRTNMFA